jgi:hypothetical protein
MNCPHCNRPIPPEQIVRAAASINGRKGKGVLRPGAVGLIRSPGRPKKAKESKNG